ncbi:MAG: type I polyketide synthase [Tetrasphaera sp.]
MTPRPRPSGSPRWPTRTGAPGAPGAPGVLTGSAPAEPVTAWLFTGQGSQWHGMGSGLRALGGAFATTVDTLIGEIPAALTWLSTDAGLPEIAGSDVAAQVDDLLSTEHAGLPADLDTGLTQTALYVYETALAAQFSAWGMTPDIVIGHSIGEVAAAVIAGVLSATDGLRLVLARGWFMGRCGGTGSMLAVPAAEDEVRAQLVDWQLPTVEVAAVNAPGSLVLSGPKADLATAAAKFDDAGIATTPLRVADAFHSALMEPALEALGRVLAMLELRPPKRRLVSTVTGTFDPATAGHGVSDPAYWTGQVRSAVRFADACRTAAAAGASVLLEVGPDRVLTGLAARTLTDTPEPVTTIAAAKRRGDEPSLLIDAVAKAWVSGAAVDWSAVNGDSARPSADIAPYPFQRNRYWLDVEPRAGLAPGMEPVAHPLLHAVLRLPDGGLVVTGTLAARSSRWLADHVVNGRILLPGTAFVELSLVAGEQADSPVLEELTLEAPLVLSETEAVTVEAVLSPADDTGRRSLSIHSYAASRGEWTRHAVGFVTATPPAAAAGLTAWPPAGAAAIDVTGAYAELTGRGYGYGPAFQGLRAAWIADGALYAEVALPEAAGPVTGYRMHPALLDIAMHADLVVDMRAGGSQALLPFAWTGVALSTPGTSTLRVAVERIRGAEESRMVVADTAGRVVLQVDRLVSRVDDPRGHLDPDLHVIGWEPVAVAPNGPGATTNAAADPAAPPIEPVLIAPGEQLPRDARLTVLAVPAGSEPTAVAATLTTVLTALQEHLAQPSGHLVVATAHGVHLDQAATGSPTAAAADTPHPDADTPHPDSDTPHPDSDTPHPDSDTPHPGSVASAAHAGTPDVDPVAAAVWGLVRGAQAEQPGRITLVDGSEPWQQAGRHPAEIAAAVATGEPELAVREGNWFRARLVPPSASGASDWDRERTVLITGGVSGLGAIIAKHLATQGVRHLTLTSRRGGAAAGADELIAELAALGATASVVACDVTDPAAIADVIAGCTPALGGVVHCAAEVASGVITDLEGDTIARALGAKALGAWNLHCATTELDLSRFVVISSAGATVLAEGQANYAAANAFLDGLAHHRRHLGLPATAVAFPLWDVVTGLGGDLTDADLVRMARLGLPAISVERGLDLFDAALAAGPAYVAALKVDAGALSRRSEVPALLRRWVRAKRTTAPATGAEGKALAEALTGMSASAAERHVLALVSEHVATVLGYGSGADVNPDKAFREVGFDSLAAVELRNALNAAKGLRLPVTLVFDHPTPRHVTALIIEGLDISAPAETTPARQPVTRSDSAEDPIAIVGMGCRFPGGVRSPEDLWALLAEGRDAMGPFPTDRGWAEDIYDPQPATPGKTYANMGGFLYDAAEFDPVFFGIGAREAIAMDPQQRQLLEVAYETIERAGIDPAQLRGSATGVWAGVMYHDYGSRLSAVPEEVASFLGNGTAASILTGRVAYTLGLEGPAVSVDTACSSSLVALHSACQSLRSGEVSMALAGGVTVMSTPELFVEFSQQKGMAADGRCKSFAAAADGTGWSEGVGLVLLERLSDAQRLGHNVLAVIRGSAMNQDGASNGMTAPNGPSQQRVIAAALDRAGLTAADVDLIEGHGTGTILGDPIEAQALLATYGRARTDDDPVWLGSIKSNLGHAQAAAGISGVIKCVLALQHGLMPQTLHVDQVSPKVDWSEGAVALLTEARAWPEDRTRRAAVSSFGLSGTNAHVILEQAPAAPVTGDEPVIGEPVTDNEPTGATPPLVLGALDSAALGRQAQALRDALMATPDTDLAAISRAALTTRTPQPVRAVLAATSREQLLADLAALSADPALCSDSVWTARAKAGRRCAFLFPGLDAQRPGMGSELLTVEPAFAAAYDEVVALLDEQPQTDPAPGKLFAYQIALHRLLTSWGIEPETLIGDSVGQLATAHVAGDVTLTDAVRLVAAGSTPDAPSVADRIAAADADGIDCYIVLGELPSPAAVIAAHVEEPADVIVVAPGAPQPGNAAALTAAESVKLAAARLFAAGVPVDREALAGSGSRASLPTYAFARQRYWLDDAPAAGGASDVVRAKTHSTVEGGAPVSGHPLLPTIVPLVTGDQVIATGRLDPAGLGWLGEHAIGASAILPGTAYVEMVLRAGAEVGADIIEELIQLAPMPFGANGVDVQVVLAADGDGWAASIHSRPAGQLGSWTEHARGRVVAAADAAELMAPLEPLAAWPPPGAEEIPVGRLYADLSEAGFGYGPAFQGVHAAWRLGDAVFAEVSLPPTEAAVAAAYGIHPALLDACMHAEQFLADQESQALPFSWNGVRLSVTGRDTVRVVLRKPDSHTITLGLHGADGQVVGSVESITLRENSIPTQPMRVIGWHEAASVEATEQVVALAADLPGVATAYEPVAEATAIVWAPVPVLGDLVARTERAVTDTIALVRDWLAGGDESARLAVLTRGAVTVVDGERIDPAASAVWGVLRAATAENPGRFAVIDVDAAGPATVAAAACGQDEAAVRGERVLFPRLVTVPDPVDEALGFDPTAPVLVTGGTGLLGQLLARHLVTAHGAKQLIVASRRGADAPGAAELQAELAQLGTTVDLVVADLSDLASVRAAIDALPVRPRAIVHAAGVMDNAAVGALTPEQVRNVLAPKVAGAWALHEATRDLEVDAFVLYSSIGGLTLAGGQANYAAANTFLDGFAQWRRAQGLPATSIAWGLWAGTAGDGQDLSEVDLRRMLRQGVRPLAARDGLSLLDRALAGAPAAVVAANYDRAALTEAAWVPALLRDVAPDWSRVPGAGAGTGSALAGPAGLARASVPEAELAGVPEAELATAAPATEPVVEGTTTASSAGPEPSPAPAARSNSAKADAAGEFAQSLTGLSKRERQASVEELVLRHTATVLGLSGPEQVLRDRGFTQMGIDSLGAVELRNRLQQASGQRLSATLIFDQPTVEELATHLLASVPVGEPVPTTPAATATTSPETPTTTTTERADATLAGPNPAEDIASEDNAFDDMDIEQLIAAAMAE